MQLKGLDLFVSLKISIWDVQAWTYAELGSVIGLSASEANAAVRRSQAAGLLERTQGRADKPGPRRRALMEFIGHGIRYAFHEEPGRERRGMPTAHSAYPLDQKVQPGAMPWVWPDPEGENRGLAFEPLYRTAAFAAREDARFYEMLSLVDAVRGGRARERELATMLIGDRLRLSK